MKKIGFVDYYISEWHANNYPAWIEQASKELGENFAVSYAWAELDKSPVDGRTTDEWCEKFGVQKCESIDELCEKSDYILVLSPDNPETHLRYAEVVLKHKKPTYIDKTFAPDYATAKKIFEIAETYKTPMFSTSALGFADEVISFPSPAYSVVTTGGGGSFERYCIHQIEMIVYLMKEGANRVMCTGASKENGNCNFVLDYGLGRYAALNYAGKGRFSLSIESAVSESENFYGPVQSSFFYNLIVAILKMFMSGKVPVQKERTLEVAAIRDALLKSRKTPFEWVQIEK